MGLLVNKRNLAKIFDVSEATLTSYQKIGMPIRATGGRRGQSNVYDTADVHDWLKQRDIAQLTKSSDGEILDHYAEKARFDKLRADRVELDLAEARGLLVDVDQVGARWQQITTNIKQNLLTIPTKAAPIVLGCKTLAQVKDALQKLIHEILTELAATDPLAGVKGISGPASTADIDDKPMGRPPPKAKSRKQRGTGAVANG